MVPDASTEGQENKFFADYTIEIRVRQMIEFVSFVVIDVLLF